MGDAGAIFEAASILRSSPSLSSYSWGGYASGPALVAAFLLGSREGFRSRSGARHDQIGSSGI